MSATKLGALVDAIKAAVDAADITSRGNALRVYTYEPRDLDSLPALTIDGPTSFRRIEPDEAESQLGSTDWHLAFTLRLYVAFDDPAIAIADARALVGQVIAAIDADRTLGGEAEIDAGITRGDVGITDSEEPRQMVVYEMTLEAWALV